MNLHRIEVHFKNASHDVQGRQLLTEIREDLGIASITGIRTAQVYLIEGKLTKTELGLLGSELFTDTVIQTFTCDVTPDADFSFIVDVGFKPGVTDNTGQTAEEGIRDILGKKVRVYTVRQYTLSGPVSKADLRAVCEKILYNPIIEYYSIRNSTEYVYPRLSPGKLQKPEIAAINLNVDEARLLEISQKGVLALNLREMIEIREYYKRVGAQRKKVKLGPNPTDVELEMIAQTWSEHCKHKIFNAVIHYAENGSRETIASLYKTYIQKSTKEISKTKRGWLVSVFKDNAGIVRFNNKYNIAFKVETHNHPSAIEPYGGAITGIVGVNRDIMGAGLGAHLLFNTDIFCFAPPDFPQDMVPGNILHPRRILKGVRKGVEHGGNKIGIPTVNGAIVFDAGYVGNPLVYCGTGGIVPRRVAGRDSSVKRVYPGDWIVMVGGRIGKDGIHGATFSSQQLDEDTSVQAVQIGAPIVQKRMMEVLLTARDRGMVNAITDNGAGGLSSSVGEMAELSNGCYVELDKAPLKYEGLLPWEIWVSEAQERMTVAVPPERGNEFLKLCERYDVEATRIGEFTDSGKVHVTYRKKTVAYLDLEFLHDGLPTAELYAEWRHPGKGNPPPDVPRDLTTYLMKILGDYSVCSKENVIRQYDHEVQGNTIVKPLVGAESDGPQDAGILKPIPDDKQGVVISNGINPRFGEIDTYWMAASVIDEAIRNIVAAGGNCEKIVLLDNFCWGNPIQTPENPDGALQLGMLVRAAKACHDMSGAFGTPFISGKDSFHNEFKIAGKTYAIPPTLLVSAMGIIDDVRMAVTMDAKAPGDIVYIVGETNDEMGGSIYYKLLNIRSSSVPVVDPKRAKAIYKKMNAVVRRGLVESIHDCSEGGVAAALAETAFAGGFGLDAAIGKIPGNCRRDDHVLFSESNSRFIVTVNPKNKKKFEAALKGIPFARIGKITAAPDFIIMRKRKNVLIKSTIDELKKSWQKPLSWI